VDDARRPEMDSPLELEMTVDVFLKEHPRIDEALWVFHISSLEYQRALRKARVYCSSSTNPRF
jgi:hypothetical protein